MPDIKSLPEAEQREIVIEEAKSWLGTMYVHMGRVKAVKDAEGKIIDVGGTDCAQFVWSVYYACGLAPFVPLEYYPRDWHMHRSAEKYLDAVRANSHEVDDPQPGDLVMYKMGRTYSHGAIIVEPRWPKIVHAYFASDMVTEDDGDAGRLAGRPMLFYSVW